ncbi:MAG: sigma 54-interacting transcriptional regulator, partial [Candidatus Krumholzibacteriia bacterium]
DEIGDVSPLLQLKLLRVLQEKEIRRVGEDRPRKVDVRIITATNKDLASLVFKGTLRQDFYYRIRVFEINMPPLAKRREDIPLLADHLIAEISRSGNKQVKGIEGEALQKLMEYPWPGNVRELRNAIEHAMVILEGESLAVEHLPVEIRNFGLPGHYRLEAARISNPVAERRRIEQALRASRGNRSRAAKSLGISRVTLWKRIRKFGIDPVNSIGG